MNAWLRSLLPTRDSVRDNRWLRWLGPALLHPRLWHMSRRGLALGLALGVFFGFLVPIAQIPLSAAAAVMLRANLPVAMASTLVTNPATFGPIYYAAWRVGSVVLGEPASEPPPLEPPPQAQALSEEGAPSAAVALAALPSDPPAGPDSQVRGSGEAGWWGALAGKFAQVGKPLVVGLVIFACAGGLLCYVAVTWVWVLRVRLQRRQRQQRPPGIANP